MSNTKAEALAKLITQLERLESLASNHSLCAVLWSLVEGQDWALHAQSKQGMKTDFPKAVEESPIHLISLKNTEIAAKLHREFRRDPNCT